jgi:molecular chaperone DnaK
MITANSGLSEADIKAMITDAQVFADMDNAILEESELQTRGTNLLHQVNGKLDELGDNIAIEDLARLDKGIIRLRRALESADRAEIRVAMEILHDLCKDYFPTEEEHPDTLGAAQSAQKPTKKRRGLRAKK